MSWNYRVLKSKERGHDERGNPVDMGYSYSIVEAYYKGRRFERIESITADSIAANGESLEELREDLKYMLAALDKPAIDEERFMRGVNARRAKKGLPAWEDERKLTQDQLAQATREMREIGKVTAAKGDGRKRKSRSE